MWRKAGCLSELDEGKAALEEMCGVRVKGTNKMKTNTHTNKNTKQTNNQYSEFAENLAGSGYL